MLIKHITVILTFVMIICTSFAADTVAPGVNDNCDYDTLGSYSEPVSLTAKYEPNTFTLNYYNGDTRIDGITDPEMTQCIYDDKIAALPPAPEERPGYEFVGWRVKRHCTLSDCYPDGDIGIDYGYINSDGTHSKDDDTYGLEEYDTWATEFTTGIIKGRALCSGLQGNNHDFEWGGDSSDWTATESAILSAPGEKKYCWCAVTSFGNQCSVSSPSWIFLLSYVGSGADGCASYCANECGENLKRSSYSSFRRAIFGIND